MVPFLLRVPSIFSAGIGFVRFWSSNVKVLAYFWSINSPPAPLSIRVSVLTFFSFIFTGMVKEFSFINPLNTVKILVEDTSIDLGLQIKNPTPVPLCKTSSDLPYPRHLWLLWFGCVYPYTLVSSVTDILEESSCNLWTNVPPLFISLVLSSTVIVSTSIAFRSGLGLKLNF